METIEEVGFHLTPKKQHYKTLSILSIQMLFWHNSRNKERKKEDI